MVTHVNDTSHITHEHILHSRTTLYKNITHVENKRFMLKSAGLPNYFWVEAIARHDEDVTDEKSHLSLEVEETCMQKHPTLRS